LIVFKLYIKIKSFIENTQIITDMTRATTKDASKTNWKTVSNKSKKIQKIPFMKAAKGVKRVKPNGGEA
jgi:hypothetical protein